MAVRSFKDESGREWTPRVDGNVVYEYECRTGISIFKAMGENTITGPIPGIKEMLALLWLSVEEKAKAQGLSEVEFRKGIIGKATNDAMDAIKEAVFDFFPPLRTLAAAFEQGAKAKIKAAAGPGSEPTSSASA